VSKDIVDAAWLKLDAEVDLKAKVRSTDASKLEKLQSSQAKYRLKM
jgi:hypothetical protein